MPQPKLVKRCQLHKCWITMAWIDGEHVPVCMITQKPVMRSETYMAAAGTMDEYVPPPAQPQPAVQRGGRMD